MWHTFKAVLNYLDINNEIHKVLFFPFFQIVAFLRHNKFKITYKNAS